MPGAAVVHQLARRGSTLEGRLEHLLALMDFMESDRPQIVCQKTWSNTSDTISVVDVLKKVPLPHAIPLI